MSPKQKAWLKGALVAAISGGATAASVVTVTNVYDLKGLGAAFLVGGITAFVLYLRQSPLPVD